MKRDGNSRSKEERRQPEVKKEIVKEEVKRIDLSKLK